MRILGAGKTGLSIKEVYSDASLFVDTDRNHYDANSEELTVVSPGIPPHNELVKNTKNLISEYDLFSDKMPFSIWISGTNGKTTTTQMLQHLLESSGSVCGGNIGTPIATLDAKAKIWILETSSFTLHYTNKAKPNIYILLPISDDHLSWHGTFEEYEQSKLKPLSLMNKDDIAIVPSKYKQYPTDARVHYYSNSTDISNTFGIECSKIEFKEPFLMDSLLALCVTKILHNKIDYNLMNQFVQDAHKLEEFRDKRDRVWIDDSKATNIDATIQALKTYKENYIYLILGGDDKGANLIPLFKKLSQYDVTLYLIGKNSTQLMELSRKFHINAKKVDFLKKAVEEINKEYNSTKGSVCMLSPAAASLDQFASYKERGVKFKEFVHSFCN